MTSYSTEARPSFLAANLLSRRNESRAHPCTKEDVEVRCKERIELCESLQKIDPDNPTWEYAKEFFYTFPKGGKAVWQLLKGWGVWSDRRDTISAPPGMENAYPREVIDLDRETMENLTQGKVAPTDQIFQSAEKARRTSLTQYDILKNNLLNTGSAPLLCRDYISTMQKVAPNAPLCLIGLSADEANAYRMLNNHNGQSKPPLVGINKGYSPAVEEKIRSGEIIEIPQGVTIASGDLERGKTYITKGDITKNIPLEPDQFKIGSLYVWHHFPLEEREKLLQQLINYSLKFPDGKVAVGIFEPYNNRNLLRMVNETNSYLGQETSGFDALVGTTACGGQTPEGFLKEVRGIAPDIKWRSETYPKLPPFQVVQRKILPTQQVAVLGWKPSR